MVIDGEVGHGGRGFEGVDEVAGRRHPVEGGHGEARRRGREIPYLCDLRHVAYKQASMPAVEPGAVSRWRMKDRVSVTNLENLLTCGRIGTY